MLRHHKINKMCDPKLLCTTKTVLTFLLNSNRSDYNTIYTLDDAFFNYVGCRIPYYELGYPYLQTFFESIPDVLHVEPFSKQVYPSNCRNQPQSNNVTQWQRGNEFPPLSVSQSSNNSQQMRSSTVTTSLPKIEDKSTKEIEKSITLLELQTSDLKLLSPRKNGAEVSVTIDVVTHEPSIIESRKVASFSCNENLTPNHMHSDRKVASFSCNENLTPNHMQSDDIDTGSRVDTKVNEHKNMPCFHLKPNDIVNAFPPLAEKGLSDRNTADSDNNSPPPYSEVAMTTAHYYDNVDTRMNTWRRRSLNADHELIKESVESFDASFDSSDSSDDEVPHKPNPNKAIWCNNGATPFIADDDPILMIGSKYSNERYGGNIETVNIESKMEVRRFYELYISEVNSPYKFWFQLTEDNNCELYELEKQLNSFYNTSSKYSGDLIDEMYMAKGYPCAAFYFQQWHRAEFIEKPDDKKVKLFFVDYGTVAKVSTIDIRYLLKTFCRLPRLCFRGTLDFIRPKHQRWNNEATTYLLDLIRDVQLVAGVSEINTKHNSARLYIMDQSKNIIINCKLVEDGYAFPEDPRDRCQNHITDMFPTFESLEKGEYPSLAEMAQGFDAENMFETKIIDGVDCYISPHMTDEEAMETINKFQREKQMAKETAAKRDATMFMLFFERMLNNPFLNGIAVTVFNE